MKFFQRPIKKQSTIHNFTIEIINDKSKEKIANKSGVVNYKICICHRQVGSIEVNYSESTEIAIINKITIDSDFRRQGAGRYAIGYIISNTSYKIKTEYEWETAYEFWRKMRTEFGSRIDAEPN